MELQTYRSSIARIETLRIGAEQTVVSWTWSSGKPPGLIQDLYLQVVPAKSEEDERREVVDRIFSRFASGLAESDDNFIQAHTSGNGQIVHFQVTDEEQSEGRKCVRLVPNSTYEILSLIHI